MLNIQGDSTSKRSRRYHDFKGISGTRAFDDLASFTAVIESEIPHDAVPFEY